MKTKLLLIGFTVLLYSCGGGSDDPMDGGGTNPPPVTGTVTYNKDIQPIVMTTCATANCHLGSTGQAGFGLETYALFKSAAQSRGLFTRIQSSTNPMPPTGKMSQANINLFLAWRDQGYLEN
jgi:hypothetical protein